MPDYRTYGARDDRIAKDGDVGFIGFNNRVRPDQLGKGMLADSQNMRLDLNGEAQVRKGIELIEAPFAVGTDVLRLPNANEILPDETGNPTRTILPSTIKSASLDSSTNVVTLVVERLDTGRDGHDWAVNDIVVVEGVASDGTDVNGTHTIDSVTDGTDVVTITYDLTASVASTLSVPLTLQFDLDDAGTPPRLNDSLVIVEDEVQVLPEQFNSVTSSGTSEDYTITIPSGGNTGENGGPELSIRPLTSTDGSVWKFEADVVNNANKRVRVVHQDNIYGDNTVRDPAIMSGNFVVGETYIIAHTGTQNNPTNFVAIGSADNNVGTQFTATGSGGGSGSARLLGDSDGYVDSGSTGHISGTFYVNSTGAFYPYVRWDWTYPSSVNPGPGDLQVSNLKLRRADVLMRKPKVHPQNSNTITGDDDDYTLTASNDNSQYYNILYDDDYYSGYKSPINSTNDNDYFRVKGTVTNNLDVDLNLVQGSNPDNPQNIRNIVTIPAGETLELNHDIYPPGSFGSVIFWEHGVATGTATFENVRIFYRDIGLIPSDEYRIETVGTTDFTQFGASSNTVGEVFIATGTGSGSGTASRVREFPQSVIGYKMGINESQITEVYASTKYSDPNDQNSQYIILAANDNAVAKNIQTGATQTINYTGTQAVGSGATMLQAFNKVFIFREGSTALAWDGDFNNDFELVESGEYEQPVQIVCASGEFAITENRGVVHQQDGVQVGSVIEVLSAKTDPADQNTNTSGLKEGARFDVAKIFTGGDPVDITDVPSVSSQISGGEYDGLYKVDLTLGSHSFQVGDPIDIAGFDDNKLDGARFVAEKTATGIAVYIPQTLNPTIDDNETVTLAHGFEFYINSDGYDGRVTDGLTLTSTPIFTREVSVGLGFTHMPAPPYAIYHQRRLVMPFKYTVNNAENSYTLTGNADEIIASDILDSDTYDRIYAQYRFNAGTADFNVGLHSFANDTLIVFNRNSIHEVRGMIDLKNASSRLITDEVGLVARQSVVQVGSSVIFLSDNGVYNLQFLDEYNLRGGEVPMSEAIDATMKRINQNAWDKSVAVYFDNRYFLAVPLNYFNEEGELVKPTKNNAILVYSFLNKQWESIDTVDNTEWDIENLIVAGRGDERGVYAVNALGGIHRLDYREDGRDRVVAEIGGDDTNYDIKSSMTTRQYTIGTMERKKWKEFDLHVQSSDDYRSDFTITAETENPDAEFNLGTLSSYNDQDTLAEGEDVSIRGRIGNRRGYGLQFTFNNTTGRPRIRAIEADGSASFRSTTTAD